MTEVERIADLLVQGYDGRPWYGTALRKLLADVTAERAAAVPFPGAHSIWQEVLHVIAWRKCVCRQLAGETDAGVSDEENWPKVSTATASAWNETLAQLATTQSELIAVLNRLTDDRLSEQVAGKPDTFYIVLHGIIHHDAYHAGQIALLKNHGF